jgi:hypothetical protein
MTTFHSDTTASVKEQAIALPEGCSMRGVCPSCGTAAAFRISRVDSELRYICFSASCTCRGVISSRNEGGISKEQFVIRHAKIFNGTLSLLTDGEHDWLANEFGINTEWLQYVRYCEEDSRVYYPQLNMNGSIQGYIARYYPDLADGGPLKGAKALWKAVLPTDLGLCFPAMSVLSDIRKTGRLCVVEDYPSALRINSQIGYPTCCLGGTNIYDKHISDMLKAGVKDLVILLDADAIAKAVKLKRSLALAFNSITILPLMGPDPKDMSQGELNKVFKRLKDIHHE